MYWLLKSEPSVYSFTDLQKDKTTAWDGITNALALKHLRTMKIGDEALIYHSGDEKAAIGTATIIKAAYPDPKQDNEKRVVVDLRVGKPLAKPVTLAQIKADPRFRGWDLIRIGRLSVVPTTPEQWNAVMKLAAG
jgi:predicted RNA-binding protein with PUA-like domain